MSFFLKVFVESDYIWNLSIKCYTKTDFTNFTVMLHKLKVYKIDFKPYLNYRNPEQDVIKYFADCSNMLLEHRVNV